MGKTFEKTYSLQAEPPNWVLSLSSINPFPLKLQLFLQVLQYQKDIRQSNRSSHKRYAFHVVSYTFYNDLLDYVVESNRIKIPLKQVIKTIRILTLINSLLLT